MMKTMEHRPALRQEVLRRAAVITVLTSTTSKTTTSKMAPKASAVNLGVYHWALPLLSTRMANR